MVAITLMVPADTSERERVFSLMNDLKTAERNSLGNILENLMKWHFMAKEMPCEQVPVMEILHEFCLLAGIRGRNAHWPHQPPHGSTPCSTPAVHQDAGQDGDRRLSLRDAGGWGSPKGLADSPHHNCECTAPKPAGLTGVPKQVLDNDISGADSVLEYYSNTQSNVRK